jgi:hypothetical protein
VATPLQVRALFKSFALHAVALAIVLLLPAGALRRSAEPEEVDVVFQRPATPIDVPPPPAVKVAPAGGELAAGPKAAPAPPARTPAPPEPRAPERGEMLAAEPGIPTGPEPVPESPAPARQKAGMTGLLALRDQFASLAQNKETPKLGADARYRAADDLGHSSGPVLTAQGPGGSGGIDASALSRDLGGGGGSGTGGGMQGVAVGRAQSSIAGIGGSGGPRALGGGGSGAHGGPRAARTDEEIQIVFDRHKASFYRLYHHELRNDPSLRGQMVLKLTIEPDGSVSMCALQSTDMKAPDLATQVVGRVREINFGAKEGVSALTIVYPIDFLPAA